MLAALALSRFEVPLARSAAILIMQFENTRPHNVARIYTLRLLRGKNIALSLAALCLACNNYAATIRLDRSAFRSQAGHYYVRGPDGCDAKRNQKRCQR